MFTMKVPNCKSYLGSVELGSLFWESSAIPQMHEQLSTSDEPHHKKYLLVGLKDIVHAHQERMVCLQ